MIVTGTWSHLNGNGMFVQMKENPFNKKKEISLNIIN